MKFGKREKMVAGGIAAVGLMAVLHFTLFGPRADAWKNAAAERDKLKADAAAIKVAKPEDITALTSRTTVSLDMLTSGVKALGMKEADAFVMPDFTGAKPEDLPKLQAEAKKQIDLEIPMVLDEIKKLQNMARAAAAAGSTRLSFLNAPTPAAYGQPQGWALPVTLPDRITRDPNAMLDAIKVIAEYKRALNMMPANSDAYFQSRSNYYNEINQKLGIDYFYIQGNVQTTNRQLMMAQPWPGWPGVANFGQFVPAIDKFALANLILEQVAKYEQSGKLAVIPGVGRLNREAVFDIVDIDITDLGNIIDGMKQNKLYFLYEEMLNLNVLVKMASDQKLTDVTFVCLDGYSYLKQWSGKPGEAAEVPADLAKLLAGTPYFPYQSDELTIGDSGSAAPKMDSGMEDEMLDEEMYNMEQENRGGKGGGEAAGGAAGGTVGGNKAAPTSPNAPIDQEEIGIALPIKMIYQGTNDKIWKYIYDVLRAQPMTELQRMSFRTMSQLPNQATNQNIEGTVTFVVVPKMFSVVDDVRKQLLQIKTAPATPPAAENNPM